MKKALIILAVILIISSLSVSAAEIKVQQFVPTLDGVLTAGEWPDSSWYVLDKAKATAYNGVWTGTMTDDLMAKYNFAWSADGLYVALVAVDNTPDPATTWDVHSQDGGPMADVFQFNTGATWITIGAYADGTLAPRNHAGGGQAVDDLAGIVTGKAVREGNVFTVEAFIPWAKFINFEVKQDSKIPLLFTYMDRADSAENVCYKSIDTAVWDGTTGDNSLTLTADKYVAPAPVVETAATAAPAAADAAAAAAPQTADAAAVIGLSSLLVSCMAFVALKKKK
jgi:hypothetical protein